MASALLEEIAARVATLDRLVTQLQQERDTAVERVGQLVIERDDLREQLVAQQRNESALLARLAATLEGAE